MIVGRFVPRPPGPPNIVLIVVDTLRADRARPGNAPPFLASLMARGTTFVAARSPSNWTLPAHASLFTGLLPSEHGATFEHRYLADEAETIAEAIGREGYRTAAFSSNVNVSRTFHLDQGFDEFYETWNDPAVKSGTRPSDALAAALSHWLGADPKPPLFLFVNLMDAHLPYRVPDALASAAPEAKAIDDALLDADDFFDRVLAGEVKLDDAFRRGLAARYDAAVLAADAALERVHGVLAGHGVLDDALLIVTSDHGEELGEDGRVDHQGSLAESLLRVPLVLVGTGVDAGQVSLAPVSTADVQRWMQDAHRRGLKPMQLRAMRPAISERQAPVGVLERLAARRPQVDRTRLERRETCAVSIDGAWKLLRREGEPPEFFRLTQAPGPGERAEPPISVAEALNRALDEPIPPRRPVIERFEREKDVRIDEPDLAQLPYGGRPPQSAEGSVHAQVHLERGNRAFAAGDWERALADYQAAVALRPGFADAWFNRALALEKKGADAAEQRSAWEAYLDRAYHASKQDDASIQQALERVERLKGKG